MTQIASLFADLRGFPLGINLTFYLSFFKVLLALFLNSFFVKKLSNTLKREGYIKSA